MANSKNNFYNPKKEGLDNKFPKAGGKERPTLKIANLNQNSFFMHKIKIHSRKRLWTELVTFRRKMMRLLN